MAARILIVDDEPINLEITRHILQKAGYEVFDAATGEAGLQCARTLKPDLMLLDVNLPDIQGYEVCRQVKTDASLVGVFVVMFSATSTDTDSQAAGLELGADGFIARPIGSRELVARMDAMLRIRAANEALRQSEQRFRLISYATNDIVTDWNLVTGLVWRNTTVQRMLGFRPEQVRPEISWWEENIHPEDREKVVRSLQTAIDTGEDFWSKEYRFRCADASYLYIFDRAYIIREDDGKPIRLLGTMMDITARKQAEEVLRQEALHDPLTGLFNRRYMEEMFEREILRAERYGQPISLIMIDVDRFKQVNDSLGHAAGDALLRALGKYLLNHIRGADIACRYGGDEFVLILPGAQLEAARERSEILRKGGTQLTVEPYGTLPVAFSLSIGVAAYPDHGVTLEALFAEADKALYSAKQNGRNRVVTAKPNSRRRKS